MASLKGGSGKTASAVLIAEAAADRDGKALLVDTDPQSSAMRWSEAAAEDGRPGLRSITVSLATSDLRRRLEGIADGYRHVVIDTPPGHIEIVRAAARTAEIVLVPCQPSPADLDRLRVTLDLVADEGCTAAVILTRGQTGTRLLLDARAALDEAELPVLAATVPQRQAVAAAYGTRPDGVALDLYRPVLAELEEIVAHLRKGKKTRA